MKKLIEIYKGRKIYQKNNSYYFFPNLGMIKKDYHLNRLKKEIDKREIDNKRILKKG